VPERVDDRRAAAVGLVGGLALDRGAVPPGPLGGPVDVVNFQVKGVAERRGGVRCAHGHVGPEVGSFGEHQHRVADADLGVADRAVRVDVGLAAPLRAEHLDVPVHGAPGVGHDDVGGQGRRPGGGALDLDRGGRLRHGSSSGCEHLLGQPLPQPPGEVGVGIDLRDGLAQSLERICHREPSSPS
jgi:hypothetical protein